MPLVEQELLKLFVNCYLNNFRKLVKYYYSTFCGTQDRCLQIMSNIKHCVFNMLFGLENWIKQDENIGLNFIGPCLSSP